MKQVVVILFLAALIVAVFDGVYEREKSVAFARGYYAACMEFFPDAGYCLSESWQADPDNVEGFFWPPLSTE